MKQARPKQVVAFVSLFFILLLTHLTNALAFQSTFKSEVGVDRPGADYRSIDLATTDYRACQSLCAKDNNCRSFTYVKPGVQSPNAKCYLKHGIPLPKCNSCCVSGYRTSKIASQPDPPTISCTQNLKPNSEIMRLPAATTGSDDASDLFTIRKPEKPIVSDPQPGPEIPTDPVVPPVTADPDDPSAGNAVNPSGGLGFTTEQNTNRVGGDYRRVPLDSYDLQSCQILCADDARCNAFTLATSSVPGVVAVCYLKSELRPPIRDACCISGIKVNQSGWWGGSESEGAAPIQ